MHREALVPLRAGILLALCSILLGFGLGGVFGVAEDSITARLDKTGTRVLEEVYQGDVASKDQVVRRSWGYLKRSHLHGGAIGATALACILVMAGLGRGGALEKVSAAAFGAGALLYSAFWMTAAFRAPALGGTHAAKEALSFVAIPGAGLCLVGLIGTLAVVIRSFGDR